MNLPENPTIIEVWAPKCAQCKRMKPVVESVAAQHPEVSLKLINAADDPWTVKDLMVRATPTFIGVRNGREVARVTGRRASNEMHAMFEAVANHGKAPKVGRQDVVLRVGAGAVLTVAGLAAGPSWMLVAVGLGVSLFGLVSRQGLRG